MVYLNRIPEQTKYSSNFIPFGQHIVSLGQIAVNDLMISLYLCLKKRLEQS